MVHARGLIFAFLIAIQPASAILDTTIWQPGEVVDVQTDLSQFSFSVPHAVGPYAFSLRPRYSNEGYDPVNLQTRNYEAGLSGFGVLQWQKLRMGIISDFSSLKYDRYGSSLAGDATLMVSYFWSWISLGIDAGAGRTTIDEPRAAYLQRYGGSSSIFGNRWAVDLAVRTYWTEKSAYHFRGVNGIQMGTGIAQARWRYDPNYRWRFILHGKYLLDRDRQVFSTAASARLRSGALQLFFGSRFSEVEFETARGTNTFRWIEIPLGIIFEHSTSLFYVGAVNRLWSRDIFGVGTGDYWEIKLTPNVGYVWRVTPASYFGLHIAQVTFNHSSNRSAAQYQLAFQFTHNLAPFGYDDEVPDRDNLAAVR